MGRTRRKRAQRRKTRRQRGGGDINVKGGALQVCSRRPMTGYSRDGYCSQRENDSGTHVVCAKVTDEFLRFTKSKGNNLITPSPANDFPGLKDGDRWCLCAVRWAEAEKAGKAPPVILSATHTSATRYNPLETYEEYSA